jgi:hypothetical protein
MGPDENELLTIDYRFRREIRLMDDIYRPKHAPEWTMEGIFHSQYTFSSLKLFQPKIEELPTPAEKSRIHCAEISPSVHCNSNCSPQCIHSVWNFPENSDKPR